MKTATRVSAVTFAISVALASLAGCSSKAQTQGGDSEGGVRTGPGVSNGEINLGLLVDLSGNFAPIGKEMAQASQLFWEQKNAAGGVCGTYPVKLDVKDNAYNVQSTVSLYSSMKSNVLAFQNVLGSAPGLALLPGLEEDKILAILHGQGQDALGHENLMMTGATFDIEAMNGLGYLQSKSLIADGAVIGDIYLQGSFGEAVLEGVKEYAEEHKMTVEASQVTAATTDLTPVVADLKSKNVDVIVFSGTPPQLASVATAAEAAGLNVPILGSTPTWTAGLLKTPAAAALTKNLHVAYPVAGFDNEAAGTFRKAYVEKYPGEEPSLQIINQYAETLALEAVLENACENSDLTQAGVLEARSRVTTLETNGVTPTLDLSAPSKPSTGENFIMKVNADVPGGLQTVEGPYRSEDAKSLLASK